MDVRYSVEYSVLRIHRGACTRPFTELGNIEYCIGNHTRPKPSPFAFPIWTIWPTRATRRRTKLVSRISHVDGVRRTPSTVHLATAGQLYAADCVNGPANQHRASQVQPTRLGRTGFLRTGPTKDTVVSLPGFTGRLQAHPRRWLHGANETCPHPWPFAQAGTIKLVEFPDSPEIWPSGPPGMESRGDGGTGRRKRKRQLGREGFHLDEPRGMNSWASVRRTEDGVLGRVCTGYIVYPGGSEPRHRKNRGGDDPRPINFTAGGKCQWTRDERRVYGVSVLRTCRSRKPKSGQSGPITASTERLTALVRGRGVRD